MSSTPMDVDIPEPPPPPPTTLNITRTLGDRVPSTSPLTEVIPTFRPTKVRIHLIHFNQVFLGPDLTSGL
jgi:COMPASS component SWD2